MLSSAVTRARKIPWGVGGWGWEEGTEQVASSSPHQLQDRNHPLSEGGGQNLPFPTWGMLASLLSFPCLGHGRFLCILDLPACAPGHRALASRAIR